MRYVNDTLTETRSFEPGLGTFGWMDDGSGQGTTMPDTSAVAHYHSDLIGTMRRMSDSTGAASLNGSVTYTAFGERVCALTGSCTPDDANPRYGYAGSSGYQSHDDFPFLHVGARYYDPATGRFLQRDPIGIAGGLNVYAYVRNHPTNRVDPDGLIGIGPINPPKKKTGKKRREDAGSAVRGVIDGIIPGWDPLGPGKSPGVYDGARFAGEWMACAGGVAGLARKAGRLLGKGAAKVGKWVRDLDRAVRPPNPPPFVSPFPPMPKGPFIGGGKPWVPPAS